MFVMVSVEGLDVTVNGSKEVDKIFFLVKKKVINKTVYNPIDNLV